MAFLGIDLGTGSAKAAVVASDGRVLARSSRDHAVHSRSPGAAESDGDDWLASVAHTTRAVLDAAGDPAIDAIGLSGQMHGVVCADRNGTPLRPALLWADVRGHTAPYARLRPAERQALANPVVAGMFGPLLAWALDAEPGLRARLRWALSPKDWLRLTLTGRAATEPSDASATLLWDIPASDWSAPALAVLGIEPSLLPALTRSDEVAGRLDRRGAGLLGLPSGTPVAAGAADVAAGLTGSGLPVGHAQLSIGTGAQIVVPIDDPGPLPDPVTHRYRRADPTGWYAMAAVQNAGLALQWVRDVLGAGWDEMHAALDTEPPGAGGVTFHGYLSGERTPVLDTSVRGAWQGLGLHTTRAALLRSALEGVAFAVRDACDALTAEGVHIADLRLVGGGTGDPRWRMLLAAALGRTLTVHRLPDVSVVGAARLAASAVGADLPPVADDAPVRIEPAAELVAALDDAWRQWRDAGARLRT